MFSVGVECDCWLEFKVSNMKSKIKNQRYAKFCIDRTAAVGKSIWGIDLGNREGEMSQRGFRRLSMNVRSPVILSIVVSIILSIILSQPAIARDNFWQPLAPIEGGWIACSAYDSATDTIYIGTYLQSSYGGTSTDGTILKSSDHGASWVDIGAGLSALTQFHRVSGITRTASGALFVALDGGGVARTLDGGANWALMNTGLQIGNCPSCAKINSIRFAPDGTGYITSDIGGVFISTTGGTSWTASNSGLTTLNTKAVEFVGSATFVATRGGGVFRRIGSGAWSAANSGLGTLMINFVGILPNGRLSAATDTGIWTMDTTTLAWTVTTGPFTGQLCMKEIGVGSALLVCGSNGVDISSNNGAAWQAADAGIPNPQVMSLVADSAGRIFGGTTRVGLYRTLDGAASWQSANTGVQAVSLSRIAVGANGTIHAGSFDSGVFRSVDGGSSWQPPTLVGWKIFAIAVSPWGDVFAGNYNLTAGVSDGHVWRSQNDGQTWSMLGSGMPAAMVSGFDFPAVNKVNCTTSWNPGGVWHSPDNGLAWTHTGPTQNIPAYCLVRTPNNDMYFGTEGLGVWRLPGDGSAAQNMGLTTSQQLAITADAQGIVYVASDRNLSALWRSLGSGQPFVATALPGSECFAVVTLPSGTVYAGTRQFGIYRSSNHGDSWESVNTGIPATSCFSLALGPNGYLYAGVPGGVYRSSFPVICTADLDGDGTVTGSDLTALLSNWGATGSGDINCDGAVNGQDLAAIFAAWGTSGGSW